MENNKNETKVIAGVVRFSYAHVWEPAAAPGSEDEKYSVCLLIPKSDKKLIAHINKGIEAAKEIGKVKKWNGKIPSKLKLPLRDGDEDNDRDDESKYGHYYINANSDRAPEITEKNNGKVVPITDRDDFYSGCYGYASINFYPFDSNGNRGIACALNNLLKIKDGEPLGSVREKAENEFAEIAVDELEDLI